MLEETHWEKAAKTRMGKYLTQTETNFISKSIDFSKIRLIVDVGAEAGRFSLLPTDNDTIVVGIDVDSYSLRRLKQKNKNVTVIQADARKLPLKTEVFDAVFMIEVLDYIPESIKALAECYRILKPSSSFILSFGNQSSLKAKLRLLRGKSYMHSYKEIMQCLKRAGFVVVAQIGYSWLPFGQASENFLISLLAGAEQYFGLRQIPSWSPWVILHAKKLPQNNYTY